MKTTPTRTTNLQLAKRLASKGDVTILESCPAGRFLLVDFSAVTAQAVECGEAGELVKLWTGPSAFMASCMRDSGYRVVM